MYDYKHTSRVPYHTVRIIIVLSRNVHELGTNSPHWFVYPAQRWGLARYNGQEEGNGAHGEMELTTPPYCGCVNSLTSNWTIARERFTLLGCVCQRIFPRLPELSYPFCGRRKRQVG